MGEVVVADEEGKRVRKVKRLMEIFQKSRMSEEEDRKLAEELAEAVARGPGVL